MLISEEESIHSNKALAATTRQSLLHIFASVHHELIDAVVVKMDANSLYCSQYKDVDRSTMGTATTTDENGASVRRSTRESKQ